MQIQLQSSVQTIGHNHVELNHAGRTITLLNDFVFILIGGEPPEEFLKKVGIQMVEKTITARQDHHLV